MGHRAFLRPFTVRGRCYLTRGQLTLGTQGGMGLFDRAATPNAVPNTTNKNPIMIFAFTCLSRPQ